jgi:hypothetical protein
MEKKLKHSILGVSLFFSILIFGCKSVDKYSPIKQVKSFEVDRIAKLVERYWEVEPITVTDSFCMRSAGNIHEFYSEGDYWWPNPDDPEGPYIRKDGWSNPSNFLSHRLAMVRMSRIVGAMTSAYLISNDEKYAEKAMLHLRAWFINDSTKMYPHFLYAQAIQGKYTGRGIGLIDGLHLIEVARSIYHLQNAQGISSSEIVEMKAWFAELLRWMMTHEYGKSEMVHPNNHGTCWAMQAAAYAQLCDTDSVLAYCTNRFQDVLLPTQMADDGSFPLEMKRTKPYGYSLFNLDAMSLLAQVLYTSGDTQIWNFETPDGKSLRKGIEFIYPYLKDKSTWPFEHDVLYWDNWPVSQPSLVLTGMAYGESNYIDLWKKLEHDPEAVEVQRNLVMRYPLLWMNWKE